MQFLAIMNSLSHLSIEQDSSIGFLYAAFQRGHDIFICTHHDLSVQSQQTWSHIQQITMPSANQVEILNNADRALCDFDCIWMRTDPPVDQFYLHATYLLEYANTWVINPPQKLRDCNEKLYALHFADQTPHTRISCNPTQLLNWLQLEAQPLIFKPLDGYGGLGVFLLTPQDRNARSTLELLTEHGTRFVLAQSYLPAARIGDKRVILIDGDVVGVILRTPQEDDHRGNIHVGGKVSATHLTLQEQKLCEMVGQRLKSDDIFFAGLDLIGEQLTEVNITSPTGVRELKDLYQIDASDLFIQAIEKRINSTQAKSE